MPPARHYDFDAGRAARRAAPAPTVLLLGEERPLPRSVPAAIPLIRARHAGAPLTYDVLSELLGYLLDPPLVEELILKERFETDDLIALYYGCMAAIRSYEEADPDPEAPPPAAGDLDETGATSSPDGATSSPTSPGSTTSTSTPPSSTT